MLMARGKRMKNYLNVVVLTLIGQFALSTAFGQLLFLGPQFKSFGDSLNNAQTSDLYKNSLYLAEPLAQPAPGPSIPLAPSKLELLQKKLALDLEKTPEALWGVHVISLDRNEVLFSHNQMKFFRPASTMKVLTSTFALERLGADFQFSFTLHDLPEQNAEKHYLLHADGDPSLYEGKLDEFISSLAKFLDTDLDGSHLNAVNIHLDASAFSGDLYQPRWLLEDFGDCYGAAVASFQVHLNCEQGHLMFSKTGQPTFRSDRNLPLDQAYKIQYGVGLTQDSTEEKITFFSLPLSQMIFASGRAAAGKNYALAFPVPDPVAYFAEVLKQGLSKKLMALGHSGIKIDIAQDSSVIGSDLGAEVWTWESLALEDLVKVMLKESQNLFAETLLLRAGMTAGQVNVTRAQAIKALSTFLSSKGISTDSMGLEDGSGVSNFDYVRPSDLTTLLKTMWANPTLGPIFRDALPVAGVDGTLSNRMTSGPAYNNVQAKTGTLTRVSALTGHVTSADGEHLAFAFMANDYAGGASAARAIQDLMAQDLAGFKR